MKPLTPEETQEVAVAKLKTCQRLLLSLAQDDPTMLMFEAWQSAMQNCAAMLKVCNAALVRVEIPVPPRIKFPAKV